MRLMDIKILNKKWPQRDPDAKPSYLTSAYYYVKKLKRVTDSGAHDPFFSSRRMSLLNDRTRLAGALEQKKQTNFQNKIKKMRDIH